MGLRTGTKLGPYEVIALIGAGGMGQVYKALDPRVGREVAIKVSAAQFSDRFKREARLIASLNHPNICTLYDVGPDFLVMELVEGPTLADRIKQGAIPFEESLAIARQVAAALEAAHEKGVIHRDLKPGNIKVRPDGMVKVLDFGLAKVSEAAPEINTDDSPTLTSPMASQAGEILGTAAYMSPEQARGKPVDKRADIWAFGVVLYEMLAGRRLFQGETVSDTLAAVLRAEPEWERVPATLRPLLRRCLERDQKKRLHDIADANLWLEDAAKQAPPELREPRRNRTWPAWIVAAAATLAAVAFAFIYFRQEPPPKEAVRFEIWPPEKAALSDIFSVSPDGRKLPFIATSDRTRVWIRSLETLDAQPLAGTEDVNGMLFWSPDSRFVAYFATGKLRKIEATGGPSQPICDAPGAINGGFWTSDNTVVFGSNTRSGLYRVSAAGGSATSLTIPREGVGVFDLWPDLLPDGRHFLYTRTGGADAGIYVRSLDAKPEEQGLKRLLPDLSRSVYVPSPASGSGYLLFLRAGTLMAQQFDVKQLQTIEEAVPIVERVTSSFNFGPGGVTTAAAFSASPNGVVVYRTDRTGGPTYPFGQASQFTWFDRQGKVLGVVGEPGAYFQMSLSPNAERLAAVQIVAPGPTNYDIWLFELVRGERSSRFTLHPGADTWPVWSPDGSRVAFASTREGPFNLYQKAATGAGTEERLYKSPETQRPTSWSQDGRFLLVWSSGEATKTGSDIWVLPMEGAVNGSPNADRKPLPLIRTESAELEGRFSPDGRWVAYTSNESGQNEVYVRPFDASMAAGSPASQSKWLVSKGGGGAAHWRGDGREVFYIGPDKVIMSVAVRTSGTASNPVFEMDAPKPLFKAQPVSLFWDVTPDGQRFLIPVQISDNSSAPYKVVLNWTSTLKKQ